MNKKVIIAGIILIALVALAAVYLFRPNIPVISERVGDSGFRLFPFGSRDESEGDIRREFEEAARESGPGDATSPDAPVPRLRQISFKPVSGHISFEDESNNTVIRFIERETGHVFETRSDTLETKRISNTTLPMIEEALWFEDGETLIARYLAEDNESVRTYMADLSPPEEGGGEGSLNGVFLPGNIAEVEIEGEEYIYLTRSPGSSEIFRAERGEEGEVVYRGPLSDISIIWRSPRIHILTRPSSGIMGRLYTLRSGNLAKVLEGPGLTALPNPASGILYTEASGSRVSMGFLGEDGGEKTELSLETLTEKCVWSEKEPALLYCAVPRNLSGNMPDSWYQGVVSSSDDLWMINIETGAPDFLLNLERETGGRVDAVNLSLSPGEGHVFFTNKTDSMLWSYRLTEASTTTTSGEGVGEDIPDDES